MENKAYALILEGCRLFLFRFWTIKLRNIYLKSTWYISRNTNNNILCLKVKKTLNETKWKKRKKNIDKGV